MCTSPSATRVRQRGVTLVELIVFIVVVSVGVAGLLSVTGPLLRYSPDPMVRKQMIAIAESLLLEVLQQPFTYCDPDDAKAATATSTADCTGGAAASQDKGGAPLTSASPASETRYGTLPDAQFDNVSDYGNFVKVDIDDVTQSHVMAGYTASVAVTRAGDVFGLADDGAALQVTVTVSRDGQDDLKLTGYRFRHAPRI